MLPSARPPWSVRCRGRVNPREERILLARLEAARQVYNACLGEARQRVQLVRASTAFQRARTLSRDDPERTPLFRASRAAARLLGLRAAGVCPAVRTLLAERASGQPRPRRSWRRAPMGPPTGCSWAAPGGYGACGRHQLDSVEGKTNASGMRWCADHLEWSGLVCQPCSIRGIW
jgi:hypothetical protein